MDKELLNTMAEGHYHGGGKPASPPSNEADVFRSSMDKVRQVKDMHEEI